MCLHIFRIRVYCSLPLAEVTGKSVSKIVRKKTNEQAQKLEASCSAVAGEMPRWWLLENCIGFIQHRTVLITAPGDPLQGRMDNACFREADREIVRMLKHRERAFQWAYVLAHLLGVRGSEFQRKRQGFRGVQRSTWEGRLQQGSGEREDAHFAKSSQGLPLSHHTHAHPAWPTGKNWKTDDWQADEQTPWQRDSPCYILISKFSETFLWNWLRGTRGCGGMGAYIYFQPWNLMEWGEVWALNHPGSYPSFTIHYLCNPGKVP